jgi:hypothetical protein
VDPWIEPRTDKIITLAEYTRLVVIVKVSTVT